VTWIYFVAVAAVIVLAGVPLARYADVIGEKTGLGRSWIGLVLLAATTSLPELFTGVGSTMLAPLPDIAVGDVLGSCMFNLLILSMMDVLQPESLSARAHQGHALSLGFGVLLVGVAGIGLLVEGRLPPLGWIGWTTPIAIALYLVAMRTLFAHERQRIARETAEVAAELRYASTPLATAVTRYLGAAVLVVAGALSLPRLAATIAHQTGLGETFVGSLFVAVTTSLPEVVVSLTAVRLGAIDLGVGNVLGSNLFNLLILGLDDLLFVRGPLLAAVEPAHAVSMFAIVAMKGLFLVGLTYRVLRKRFYVAWDTGAIAVVYLAAILLSYLLASES
jgi:cation:H+ antiporter